MLLTDKQTNRQTKQTNANENMILPCQAGKNSALTKLLYSDPVANQVLADEKLFGMT